MLSSKFFPIFSISHTGITIWNHHRTTLNIKNVSKCFKKSFLKQAFYRPAACDFLYNFYVSLSQSVKISVWKCSQGHLCNENHQHLPNNSSVVIFFCFEIISKNNFHFTYWTSVIASWPKYSRTMMYVFFSCVGLGCSRYADEIATQI